MHKEKDEFKGIKSILERYDYLDDVRRDLKGLVNQMVALKIKVGFYINKRTVSLKSKNTLLEKIYGLHKFVDEEERRYYSDYKHLSIPERRVKLVDLIGKVKESISEIEEVVR